MLRVKSNQVPELKELKKEWEQPRLMVYGDMASLTQQDCGPHNPHCKPKTRGLADDFGDHFSTLGD